MYILVLSVDDGTPNDPTLFFCPRSTKQAALFDGMDALLFRLYLQNTDD